MVELITATNATIPKITITNARGIQIGEVTHHQLQVMFFVSFKTTKMMNKTVRTLVPPDGVFVGLIFVFIFISLYYITLGIVS